MGGATDRRTAHATPNATHARTEAETEKSTERSTILRPAVQLRPPIERSEKNLFLFGLPLTLITAVAEGAVVVPCSEPGQLVVVSRWARPGGW